MSKSAFAALQEDLPIYEANTSDSDQDSDLDPELNQDSVASTPKQSIENTPFYPIEESKYICSNFKPNDDNMIYGDDYIIFGLKHFENLIIKGQFNLEIQRGAVKVNNVVYHSSIGSLKFLNPTSGSIPLIQAAQVTDINKVQDTRNQENDHLFHSDYKTVLKITNLKTGLENIGSLCPLFKNLFWNEGYEVDESETSFLEYTFIPILKPDNKSSVIRYKEWESAINELTKIYQSHISSLRILIIGGKNSGKSTLLRLLLQNFLKETEFPINIMDLDPGQAEFSKPDSISLSKFLKYQFGNHLTLTSSMSSINHYIGFQSPKDQPIRYNLLINDLIRKYNNDGFIKNESLIINTPGWIKGYGVTLIKNLVQKIKPTHLIYLNSGNIMELEELETGGHDCKIIPLRGKFNNVAKHSSSQLRILKTLGYFHKQLDFKFDFKPLIMDAPLQISYGQNGIKGISILGLKTFNLADLRNALEGTIVGLHTIKTDKLAELNIQRNDNDIPYINSRDLNDVNMEFKALALIHSINETDQIINLYIPSFEELTKPNNEEFIFLRGKTETPIWELAPKEIIQKFGTNLPFITFAKNSAFEKVWKSRRNVQRRGQLR